MRKYNIIFNVAFILTVFSEIAYSHEYEAYARSATGTGRAYAGEVAKAEDATSVFANPAAMSHIEGPRFSGVLHALTFAADYNVESSVLGTNEQIQGRREGDAGGIFGGPNVYWVNNSQGKFNFGFGLNTPYAYGTDYESDWVGRYHGTSSELTVFSLTSSLSYKATENFSLGISLPINYAIADFERALNQQGRCLDLGLTCETLGVDGQETVSTDGVGIGLSVGMHYQSPSKSTRFGLVYRAKETLSLSGDADYQNIDNTLLGVDLWRNTDVDLDLVLPESLSLGIAQSISEKLIVMSDITWKNWDQFNGWVFDYENNSQTNHRISANWGDGVRTAVSLDYQYKPTLTLRMGYAFDNSPVNDASQQSPLIPGADIHWFTAGASWVLRSGARVDIGYAFLDYDNATIQANSVEAGFSENALIRSRADLDLHLLSFQYNF